MNVIEHHPMVSLTLSGRELMVDGNIANGFAMTAWRSHERSGHGIAGGRAAALDHDGDGADAVVASDLDRVEVRAQTIKPLFCSSSYSP
ncbi:hypothetical protein [Bradyrhizobium murdochi]|uniref:hypothetical protein n=1 Tax=Bradyrhizobium murdochi TaxID=1038859 RepID=UPI0012EBBB37|nr:hypothetical protein [Bradyrhizobium murdochi]